MAYLLWVWYGLRARLQRKFRGYLQQLQKKLQEVLSTELGMPVLSDAAGQTATS